METLYTVYRLLCTKSGKSYIGQTCEPLRIRFSKHLTDFKCRYDGRPLHLAFRQFGTDCWEIQPLETVYGFNESIRLEIEYIDKFNSFHKGYNGNTGGFGMAGRTWSEEQKKKASEKLKAVFATKTIEELRIPEESRKKMSEAKLEHHWRAEDCIVNGEPFTSYRQAAIAYSTTIYKVKLSVAKNIPLKHGKVDWRRINENESQLKEEKYLKMKSAN